MIKKKCFKCGLVKSIDEFYKHKMMLDGHLGKCIDCTKSDVRKNYQSKSVEERRRYEKARGLTPNRRLSRVEVGKRYREKYPEKISARRAVRYALQSGKLEKGACEFEGSECSGPIHAHHDDYTKPLKVRWFCEHHHRKLEGRLFIGG